MGAWIVLGIIYNYWYIVIPLFLLWLCRLSNKAYYETTGFHNEAERQEYLRQWDL